MIDWHIELTSKCTLECPLCDRTWFYNTFKKRLIHEINVEQLINFLGRNQSITFCGNNGDPIYHSKFIEVCRKLKSNNTIINITTNGSSKTQKWWGELTKVLNKNDIINFSIDGLEDTNHIYRKNAKWNSIMDGVKIVAKSNVPMCWKFIPFKHNQHQINEAKKLSKQLGFNKFEIEYSDRFPNEEAKNNLMPDKKNVDNRFLHREKILSNNNYVHTIKPKCLKNNEPAVRLYIDAEGYFYPCCYIGSYRYKFKSMFSPKDGNFNIKKYSIKDILNNVRVKDFFKTTKDFKSAHECCKIQCGVIND